MIMLLGTSKKQLLFQCLCMYIPGKHSVSVSQSPDELLSKLLPKKLQLYSVSSVPSQLNE